MTLPPLARHPRLSAAAPTPRLAQSTRVAQAPTSNTPQGGAR
jgi:hypothetical protein